MKLVIEQRQVLKMVMTTELRQAIELLQLSNYELMQFIQKEAEENPLIELTDPDIYYPLNRKAGHLRTDYADYDPFDFYVHEEKNLYEYLKNQVNVLHLPEDILEIVHFLILNLDEHGYLTIRDEETCAFLRVSQEEVSEAKAILHQLEPLGIGASNLRECLSIQARYKYKYDEHLMKVIDKYLEDLANRKWEFIAESLNISLGEVRDIFEKIRTLQPKPAINFSNQKTNYVAPDIFVTYDEKKESFKVSLNNDFLPIISFNSTYADQLSEEKQWRTYVNDFAKRFHWLHNSIKQRRETILKIMEVIIERQRKFFEQGFHALQPLTLKDVADEIDMHESTVSRATANKIVQTPIGTFELKTLFSNKLKTKNGSHTSQKHVKEKIKQLIGEENKAKPLSDQKIADLLKQNDGIIISRRTVAKYRDEMNILSSSKRKEICK